MPRRARLFIPGCVYHVMARGIDGMTIFRNDDDCGRFLSLLAKYAAAAEIRCYAWALMGNHYHLVIRASDRSLAAMMKPLNSRYAAYLNKSAGRRGYVFQDRFKSVATQDQLYLEEMIRYVHLNPLRAGICKTLAELDTYPWCGHSALMGTRECRFQDVSTVLRRFGKNPAAARIKYREFLQAGVSSTDTEFVRLLRNSSAGTNDRTEPGMWVIGDHDFVKQATSRDAENRLRVARHAREGWDVEKVCRHVAAELGVDPARVRDRGREDERSTARKIVAFVAHTRLDLPVSAIARYFGVGQPAVSAMIDKGRVLAEKRNIATGR